MSTKGSFGHSIGSLDAVAVEGFLDIVGIPTNPDLGERLNRLYNGYVAFQHADNARAELANRVENLKLGDFVETIGFARIDGDFKKEQVAYFDWPGMKFRVIGISGQRIQIEYLDKLHGYKWTVHRNSILSVETPETPTKEYVLRKSDRRTRVQDVVESGSFLHIVKTMEDVSRKVGVLNQDQIEVLKQAQSEIRSDDTANGRRSGVERRKF